jgi:hypothetical protein
MTQQDMFTGKLHPKQREMVVKAASLLTNLGCKFYIKTPDGEEMAVGMKAAKPEKEAKVSRGGKKYPHGLRASYVKPYIDKITQAGDMVVIPGSDDIALQDIAGAAAAACHTKFGPGVYQVEPDKISNTITVMHNGGIRV